ncbi:hypothetical protein ACWGLC_15985 [Dietzia sp. NPDC055877]
MRNEKGAIDALSVPTLADLIQARKAARGWSYREIAARGNDVISAQRWQQLGTGVRLREFPEPTTMAAMADALEVDVAAVLLATAKSLGLDVQRRQSELAAMLPSTADQLTSEQRDAVLAVVRAMTPTKEQKNEDQGTQSASSDPAVDDEVGADGTPMNDQHPDTIAQVHAIKQRTEAYPDEWVGQSAARDHDGPSLGERLHRETEAAGEESQESPYDD